MRLTIEPTGEFVLVEGVVPCRVWKGVSGLGVEVRAYVLSVAVAEGDEARFEAEAGGEAGPVCTIIVQDLGVIVQDPGPGPDAGRN